MEMFDKANALQLAGKHAEAEVLYEQLLTQNHDNPGLLATAGTNYIRLNKYGLAISFLERARIKLNQSDVLCNLAIAYKYSGQYDKAMDFFEKSIKVDPTVNALTNYGALFVNTGKPEKAIEIANRALKMDSQSAMAHWNLSMAHLELGDFEKGWDEYEWGFDAGMRVRRNLNDKPYWDGTEGKTIAVYGEQGLGDEIMFASMLPDLMKNNKVVLECHSRLETLFKKSFPALEGCYGTREHKEITWPYDHEFDYSVSMGSLGRWYRRSGADFHGYSYLKADPLPSGKTFRVGISWVGGMKQGRVRTRSVPLAWWKNILDVPNVEFVSLQYTDCAAEIEVANKTNGYDIKQFDEAKAHDYYETARLVASCDLVISVCTSIIHLAGALGVKTWVMVPNKPAWRYGVKGPMPWYRSARLYRQPPGDMDAWRPVIDRVALDLSDMIDQRRREAA